MTGADSFTFLQSQTTNDLSKAQAGQAVYGLWLDQKGRVQADSFFVRGSGEEWWICSYSSPAVVLQSRMEAYIIADDVIVEDHTAGVAAVTLLAEGAAVPSAPADLAGWWFPGRRGVPSIEGVGPLDALSGWRTRLERCAVLDAAGLERARIVAGIPSIPADIGPAELPNEGGLERDALSYSKGCYLGQEVMARLKSMGQVRRHLMRVRGMGPPPAARAPVFQAGRRVGEVRSAVAAADGAGYDGLALLTRAALRLDVPCALTEDGGPAVTVLPPP